MDCLSLCIRSTGYLKLCHRSCVSTEFSQRCKISACDCVPMEFYLVIDGPPAECSLRAKSNHLAFTACSVRRLHTCTIHVVRQWYPKGPRELSRLITASILPLFELLERDNGVQLALLETLPRYHGDPISFILRVYHNAKPRRELCARSK